MQFFLTDEDVRGAIIDGLRLHHPEVDVVRAVEVGLGEMDDDELLAWAAKNGRVMVSHDVNTMIDAANQRVASGAAMSGSDADEFAKGTVWLPL